LSTADVNPVKRNTPHFLFGRQAPRLLLPGVAVLLQALVLAWGASATPATTAPNTNKTTAAPTAKPPAPPPAPPPATPPAPPITAPAPAPALFIDWLENLDDARAQAAAEKKDILLVFTCTDSSVWGQRLDTEVFSRPSFAAAISGNFVCVFLDFPKNYTQPGPEHRKNETLRKAWGVTTFPTVFLADKTGRPYAVTGYRNISAANYAAHIETLRTIREHRDQKLAATAAAVTDAERAATLSQALREIDENLLLRHYAKEIRELRRIDPKDSTGLIGDIEFAPKITRLRDRVARLIRQKKDYAGAVAAVDKFIEQTAPSGEHLQKTLFLKLPAYANSEVRNHAAIPPLMDAIIAIAPESEEAKMAAEVRAQALSLMDANSGGVGGTVVEKK
jgi:thioredoxin-related protein